MKTKTTIWIIAVAGIVALIPAGVLFYQNQRLKGLVSSYAGKLEINHKALTDSIQRAETKVAKSGEELDYFAAENKIDLDLIRDDLDSIGATLEVVASTKSKTSTIVKNYYPSDSSSSNPNSDTPSCPEDGRPIDVHSYTKSIETRELHDSNGMRVADISFSAADKNPWNSRVYSIEYRTTTTIGRGEEGQVVLTTELTAENPAVQPEETFRIEGVESRVLQAPEPAAEFEWISPALYLAGQFGVGVWPSIEFSGVVSLGVSLMSYKNWRFLGITAGLDGFNRTFFASITPFLYNIGEPLPFFSDLWIFGYIGINHHSSVSIGIGIGTRL